MGPQNLTVPARTGPRPLPLHLGAAMMMWQSSFAALPIARHGLLPWKAPLDAKAATLQNDLEAANPDTLTAALSAETSRRAETFLSAIDAYRHHPYRRRMKEPSVIWSAGAARLLDYGALAGASPGAPVVLLVPSLINRAYILDLQPRRSFARYLVRRGLRPMLLDWGTPGAEEQTYGLDDYILTVLNGALSAACTAGGGPVALLGYCMGGLLTLPAALARPSDVAALINLATPWDFHADGGVQRDLVMAMFGPFRQVLGGLGNMPVDLLQAMFAGLDPLLALRKFTDFAALDSDSAKARNFVALEDWLNDGVPLAGPVADACLFAWYGENQTALGNWQVGGKPVRPEALTMPFLNVVPSSDRIVPPNSALALSDCVPHAETLRPSLGHIGMMVSPRAPRELWRGLADWLWAVDFGAPHG